MIDIKEKIIEEYEKGNIIVLSSEGLQCMSLTEFIKQPTEGILYDLNRSESVVLTFLPDPKWVNDYAVAQVIRTLKRRIDELQSPVTTPEQIAERAGITVEELYNIVKREITK